MCFNFKSVQLGRLTELGVSLFWTTAARMFGRANVQLFRHSSDISAPAVLRVRSLISNC